MIFETSLSMVSVMLSFLSQEAQYKDREKFEHLRYINSQVTQLIPERRPFGETVPYKLSALNNAVLVLSEFYKSVPAEDEGTRAKVIQLISDVNDLSSSALFVKIESMGLDSDGVELQDVNR